MIPRRNLKRFFNKTVQQPSYALDVFRRRLGAYAYYLFGGGKSIPPESITLFLTHRCNLQCRMCGQWGREGVTKKQGERYIGTEIAPSELKSIIDDFAAFRPNITIFGGEPLLYNGCMEIIKYIKEKHMHCLMITNGFLLGDMAEDIVDSGLDELNVSLDGSAELHDQIRGTEGLFDRIMKGLRKINRLKAERHKRKPYINIQCTITPSNYLHLEELIGVADKAGADSLTFHNLIFLDKEALDKQKKYDELLNSSSLGWEGFVFAAGIEPDILHEKMKRILSGKHRFKVDFYPNFSPEELRNYYNSAGYVPRKAKCVSPWMCTYVFPDGGLRPCLNFEYSYGNVKEKRFRDLWNGKEAVIFRSRLKQDKSFPVCARCTELYRY